MNGCLGKLLFLLTLLIIMFLGYPYFTKFLSDSAQDKIHQWETTGEIIGKAVKNIGSGQINQKKKDFNNKTSELRPSGQPSNNNSNNNNSNKNDNNDNSQN